MSTATESSINITEIQQHELKYKAKLDVTVKREEIFISNKTKAYSIIWERCSKGTQSKLEQRTDFQDKIYNNPINLLKGIKQHALDYAMEVVDDALVHLLLIKQREEPLYKYVRKFKTAKEVLESHVGDLVMFTKIIISSEDYYETDLSNYKDLKEQACEQFCAYKFLKNANKQKYGQCAKEKVMVKMNFQIPC